MTGNGLTATHAPVEVVEGLQGEWTVYGHMARANPQWKSFGTQEVLLIFQGAHTYISPTWYNHLNVPTWNYMVVQVHGQAVLLDDSGLRSTLGRLVEKHETNSSYRLETLPADFVAKEMKGTVGFTVQVTRLEASYKLSQNRGDEDHARIIRELENRGDQESARVAGAMRKNRNPVE